MRETRILSDLRVIETIIASVVTVHINGEFLKLPDAVCFAGTIKLEKAGEAKDRMPKPADQDRKACDGRQAEQCPKTARRKCQRNHRDIKLRS